MSLLTTLHAARRGTQSPAKELTSLSQYARHNRWVLTRGDDGHNHVPALSKWCLAWAGPNRASLTAQQMLC